MGNSVKLNPAALLQWLLLGKGPLCSPGCDHGGFVHSSEDAARDSPGMPDLQYRFLASKTISPDGMATISDEYLKSKGHPDGFTLQAIAARPRTRGKLRLRTADPHDKPVIEVSARGRGAVRARGGRVWAYGRGGSRGGSSRGD
jgi:choline dehydrogenase-like flavoprotein